MRPLTVVALLLSLSACRTNALTNGDTRDGGDVGVDLARPPVFDLATVKCDGLDDVVGALLAAAQTCTTSNDCTIVQTRCGLPGGCGTIASTSTADALAPVLASWDAQGCGNDIACGPCPRPPDQPQACLNGLCRTVPTTCEEIRTLFDALKASSKNSCATAADCVTTTGPCGLDDCRLVFSKAIQTEMNQLTGWWGSLSCPWNGGACAKCAMPAPAVCNAGRCE